MDRPIVIRCDGGDAIGAGHVSRCLPIAEALAERGADVRFSGDFGGVAAWMLHRRGARIEPAGGGPCGIDPGRWSAAIVDLYVPGGDDELCALADALPVATIGEATRCGEAGLWIDYHAGSAPGADDRRLGGPQFAPLDPRFAAARHARTGVRRVLVMTGASRRFGELPARLADAAAEAFPDAEVLVPAAVTDASSRQVTLLPAPFDLAELAADIDLAVVAAGMTAYELASAGIPLVAVSLVENQRVVADGCRATGIALAVDGIDRDPLPDVRSALDRLHDPALRGSLGAVATATFDGRGAERVAEALLAAWKPGSDRGNPR